MTLSIEVKNTVNIEIEVEGLYVKEALNLLQSGLLHEHNKLISSIALNQKDDSTIILGQFSMASALPSIKAENPELKVLTTPDSSVLGLKRLLDS